MTPTAATTSPWASVRSIRDYKRVLAESGTTYSKAAREAAVSASSGRLRLLEMSIDRAEHGQATGQDLERIRDAEAGDLVPHLDPANHEPAPVRKPTASELFERLRGRAVAGERVSATELGAAQRAAEDEALAADVAAERRAAEDAAQSGVAQRQESAEKGITDSLEAMSMEKVHSTAQVVREALEAHKDAVRAYNQDLAAVRAKVSAVYPDKPQWAAHDALGASDVRYAAQGDNWLCWDGTIHAPVAALKLAR